MKTTTLNIRIEPDIKDQAEAIFRQLGLTPAAAVNLFFRQVILHGVIPFMLMANTSGAIPVPAQEKRERTVRTRKPKTQPDSGTQQPDTQTKPTKPTDTADDPNRYSLPPLSPFHDDETRAAAWLAQHDDEGI